MLKLIPSVPCSYSFMNLGCETVTHYSIVFPNPCRLWCHISLIPELWSQGQKDLYVSRPAWLVSSRIARDYFPIVSFPGHYWCTPLSGVPQIFPPSVLKINQEGTLYHTPVSPCLHGQFFPGVPRVGSQEGLFSTHLIWTASFLCPSLPPTTAMRNGKPASHLILFTFYFPYQFRS